MSAFGTSGANRIIGSVAGVRTRLKTADTLTLDLDALTFDDTTDGSSVGFNQGASIASGKFLTWAGSATPTTLGQVGMNVANGRLRYYDGATSREVANTNETGGSGGTLTTGTYAASAGSPAVGDTRDITGGPIQRKCYTAGTWVDYLPGVGPITLLVPGDYSTTIQSAEAFTQINGGHSRWNIAHNSGVYNLRARFKTHSPPKGYRIHFDVTLPHTDSGFGLAFRHSGNNKEWSCTVSREFIQTYNWTGGSSPSGVLAFRYDWRETRWLEIIDDGTDLSVNIGSDLGSRLGANIMSQPRATHLGGAPDLIGVCG